MIRHDCQSVKLQNILISSIFEIKGWIILIFLRTDKQLKKEGEAKIYFLSWRSQALLPAN